MGLWWIVVDKETDPSREILFLGIIVGAAILHEISHAIAARILGFARARSYCCRSQGPRVSTGAPPSRSTRS